MATIEEYNNMKSGMKSEVHNIFEPRAASYWYDRDDREYGASDIVMVF